jgi:hypothetical protein
MARSPLDFVLRLSRATIHILRDRYLADRTLTIPEAAALAAGQRIAAGAYIFANLALILNWRVPQRIFSVKGNSDEAVHDALRRACRARSEGAAIDALQELRGVNIAAASAILTMLSPERYTVMDSPLLVMLQAKRNVPSIDDYLDYLSFSRTRAALYKVSLRDLDRALWQHAADQRRTKKAARLSKPAA